MCCMLCVVRCTVILQQTHVDSVSGLCGELVVTEVQGPYAPVEPQELSEGLLHVWGVLQSVVAHIQAAQ